MIEVQFQRGIFLPAQKLWLDPATAKPLAFVSHAHSDHIARHPELITSAPTARLMQERLPGRRREHLLEFGVRTQVHGLQLTLLPAGHILGSAQLFLETAHGSLLYTGDFKLQDSRSAEPTQWRQADTLIMETTFGLPQYILPPPEQTVAQIIEFCRRAIDDRAVPILLSYSLGKSQEIICALLAAGLTPMLHPSVFKITEIYRELLSSFPGGYQLYCAETLPGKVLICPPNANRAAILAQIPKPRTAVLTGWALDRSAVYRYKVDAAFALSDHADYTDLLRYVELVQPKRVLTLHGFAGAFASDLRARGIEAWALNQHNQLELPL